MRSIGLVAYMIPIGFSSACAILIGKSIGEGSVPAIK